MVFSSITFLCLFLPIVFLLHTLVLNLRFRNAVLLIASLLFYAWGEPIWIVAMLVVTGVNYVCARILDRQQQQSRRKLALVLGLVVSLSFLVFFKYSAFLINSFCDLFGIGFSMQSPTLPIGISFYTFQIITYTVDVYRRKAALQKNPLRLLMYVCLFPQLIAGPIVRYGDVADMLSERQVTRSGIGQGFFRFSLGLAKKVVLANLCGEVLSGLPAPVGMSTASAWLAAVLFCLQLYFDFAGYSDMAIGLGRMFGFRFLENFDAPYASRSISEYWRRWHMSLGAFFREYVYIPMGGNRVSTGRWILNMAVVWGLTGLWHGASWNYLFWGVYFGFLMVLERTVFQKLQRRMPAFFQHLFTLILIVVGYVTFRNETFADVFLQLRGMFAPWIVGWTDVYAVYAFRDNLVLILISMICCLPLRKTVEAYYAKRKAAGKSNAARPYIKAALTVSLLLLSLMFLVGQSFNPFLYFRF